MVYWTNPSVSQLTIQGTPTELTTIYGKEQLGNTSLAIQIKQPEVAGDEGLVRAQRQDLEKLVRYMEIHQ